MIGRLELERFRGSLTVLLTVELSDILVGRAVLDEFGKEAKCEWRPHTTRVSVLAGSQAVRLVARRSQLVGQRVEAFLTCLVEPSKIDARHWFGIWVGFERVSDVAVAVVLLGCCCGFFWHPLKATVAEIAPVQHHIPLKSQVFVGTCGGCRPTIETISRPGYVTPCVTTAINPTE